MFAHSEFLDTDTISSHDTMIQKVLYIIELRGTKSSSDTGRPSAMVQRLKAGAGNYIKECNSDVVALDKGRLGILVALLLTC